MGRAREKKIYSCPDAEVRIDRDVTVGAAREPIDLSQAQARSLSHFLCGEERLKNASQRLRIDALFLHRLWTQRHMD